MIVDLFLVYHFIKRLATPFEKWKAFEQGIIDKDGNILKKSRELTTVKERDAWGKFDLMILKLKRLLAKVPGGSSRIASYAAALYLIKEHNNIDSETITEEELTEALNQYIMIAEEHTTDVDALFESAVDEEIANTAGSGQVAGIGVGPNGEPGYPVSKKKRKVLTRFKDRLGQG